MEHYITVLLMLGIAVFSNATEPLGSSDQNQQNSVQVFSDLTLQKYTSSSKLNVSDISNLWDNLKLQHNSSSPIKSHTGSANDEDLCNKLSNNSKLCTFTSKVCFTTSTTFV